MIGAKKNRMKEKRMDRIKHYLNSLPPSMIIIIGKTIRKVLT